MSAMPEVPLPSKVTLERSPEYPRLPMLAVVIYHERQANPGLTFKEIGEKHGITRQYAQTLFERAERLIPYYEQRKEKQARFDKAFDELFNLPPPRKNLGRPIDVGGPREVELTWTLDPRTGLITGPEDFA